MELPGAGALWMRQSFQWPAPVFAGDTVDITLRVTHKSSGSNTITIEVKAVNQDGKTVMSGEGAVLLLEQQKDASAGPVVEGECGAAQRRFAKCRRRHRAAAGERRRGGGAERSTDGSEEIVESIRQEGGAGHGDSGRRAIPSVRASMRSRKPLAEPVDVLINNTTASFTPRPFTDLKWESSPRLFWTQKSGDVFHCCQAALPNMVSRKVRLHCQYGIDPYPANAPAAMGAVRAGQISDAGPDAIAGFGIRASRHSREFDFSGYGDLDSADAGLDRLRKVQAMQTPLRRLATPDDVAQAVVFLCSEAGSFITGVDLPVCGGFSL